MTDLERRTLDRLAVTTCTDQLRRTMRNAKGVSDEVYRAALARLIVVCASDHTDPVARSCWSMVHTIEEIRRDTGRKVWRMHRLRPKIEREGERVALEYCACNRTDGFDEVLGYGLPEYTAEAIVLHHSEAFSAETRRIARERLSGAGVDVDAILLSHRPAQSG